MDDQDPASGGYWLPAAALHQFPCGIGLRAEPLSEVLVCEDFGFHGRLPGQVPGYITGQALTENSPRAQAASGRCERGC